MDTSSMHRKLWSAEKIWTLFWIVCAAFCVLDVLDGFSIEYLFFWHRRLLTSIGFERLMSRRKNNKSKQKTPHRRTLDVIYDHRILKIFRSSIEGRIGSNNELKPKQAYWSIKVRVLTLSVTMYSKGFPPHGFRDLRVHILNFYKMCRKLFQDSLTLLNII